MSSIRPKPNTKSPTFQLFEHKYQSAKEQVKKALDMDEKGHPALNQYLLASSEFRESLSLYDQLEGRERDYATNLSVKIKESLNHIHARIDVLEGNPIALEPERKTKRKSTLNKSSSLPSTLVPEPQKVPRTRNMTSADSGFPSEFQKIPRTRNNTKTATSTSAPLSKTSTHSATSPSSSDAASNTHNVSGRLRNSSALKNVDPALANIILNEVVDHAQQIHWDDIAGLDNAKEALNEIVIMPSLRPDLYVGLRAPVRGVLLFGPPGTGKTMLAKALANESNAVFFSISASSLTSKFVGESEKLVRTLFAVARELQPAIIFIDEIDSILTERSEKEHEASRRLKTEFLLQFDGIREGSEDRVLLLGATNRPQELDEAAKRRFPKRIYIPLPEPQTRIEMIKHRVKDENCNISASEYRQLGEMTAGYSGSDLAALTTEAAILPLRQLGSKRVRDIAKNDIPPITLDHFRQAMQTIRPSVSPETLDFYEHWNSQYGVSASRK